MSLPYIVVTGKINDFFQKVVQNEKIPVKATVMWLEAVGYKSKNDRRFILILKDLGFIDDNSKPTDRWINYRDTNKAAEIMKIAIEEAYKELYIVFDEPHTKGDEELRNVIKTKRMDIGTATIRMVILTYRALYSLYDPSYKTTQPPKVISLKGEKEKKKSEKGIESGGKKTVQTTIKTKPEITINIQITLPETADKEMFDELFKSMKRNLYSED
jgi:hypothetical protein